MFQDGEWEEKRRGGRGGGEEREGGGVGGGWRPVGRMKGLQPGLNNMNRFLSFILSLYMYLSFSLSLSSLSPNLPSLSFFFILFE